MTNDEGSMASGERAALNGDAAGRFTNHRSLITTPAFLPRCMDMISAEDAIRRIELYFDGGAVRYLTDAERRVCEETIPALGREPVPNSVHSVESR